MRIFHAQAYPAVTNLLMDKWMELRFSVRAPHVVGGRRAKDMVDRIAAQCFGEHGIARTQQSL